jgi:hypothetical protein
MKYVAFYDRHRVELEAKSLYAAKVAAADHFKAKLNLHRKRNLYYDVAVMLAADADGNVVVHDGAEL